MVEHADGEVLYARSPDRAMVPASNLKILTAIATLHAFGPTHRFTTEILADRAPDPQGGVGTLYVRGGGDPALTSEDYWRLAGDLRRQGLRRVSGDLVLDDSVFDGERWHPTWGRVSARAYHAPVGALTANYGAYAVTVEPGAGAGESVSVRIDPPVTFLRLTNRARTGPAAARSSLLVDRASGSDFEQVIVSGVVPSGRGRKTYHRSVLDPARYAGAVLRLQLKANGIEVVGGTRVAYAPDDAVSLLAFRGEPVAEIVRLFLKYSNNAIGESLLKALSLRANGPPGSWHRGIEALRAELGAVGLPLAQLRVVDGSGLSYENRASPRLLVDALRLASESFEFGPEFLAALPIASADGTLEERAQDAAGAARAKTGLLTRVTGLSGLARRREGAVVAFSILVNGFRGSASDAMDAVDGFLAALVGGDQERVAVSP